MVREIRVDTLAAMIHAREPVVLIDVRQPWEHAITALSDSILIPLHDLPHMASKIPVSPDSLIVIYCHHGIRSLAGASFLEKQGFANVASLAGGIDAWSQTVDPAVPRY